MWLLLMKIYQFIPLASVPVMARLIIAARPDTIPVLDLEDGLLDVRQPAHTSERRRAAREVLLELCRTFVTQGQRRPLALRLNPHGSADFEADLPVARAAASAFSLVGLLLPKVSEADDLQAADRVLRAAGLPAGCVLPILETRTALLQAREITAVAAHLGATAVVYGHHDYCLDAGLWPFPEPEAADYWLPVDTVAGAALDAGLRYVHPPTSRLRDRRMLAALLARLASICSGDFDVFSAGLSQTAALRQLDASGSHASGSPKNLSLSAPLTPEQARRKAEHLCEMFESCRRAEHAFAADGEAGRFISPHEYLAALRHLQADADA
jgi:citrate lyase beta subunit